jgi:predicted aminopeptidase
MTKSVVPVFVLVLLLSGCSTLSYYSHAVGGHIEVMQAAHPINEVIADPKCDPVLKKKLEDVRLIRDFASRELGLPDNGSYRSYADIHRPFVTWNVFAAPEFSLQPKTWCMPIVGCVGYRGFHDQKEAESLASELRQEGFDTYVGGIPAYSTLGYLKDPVLNTFLKFGSLEVARLIFHELAHQVLYVDGDTTFNESFAVAVENEGLRRWLAHVEKPELQYMVTAQQQHKAEFVELVSGYRGRLQEIYDGDLSTNAKRQAKADVMAEIQRDYLSQQDAKGESTYYKEWLEHDFNNAKLGSLGMYNQLLPNFEALLATEGYDLRRFYRAVADLGSMPFTQRRAALEQIKAVNSERSNKVTASQ